MGDAVRACGSRAVVSVVPRPEDLTGLYYAATMDVHAGFESWLERDVAMTLDFDTEVVGGPSGDHGRVVMDAV